MGMTRLSGMGTFRRLARIVTVLVTVAYLLPVLLTFMPSPASAEEQALYADLMQSRCVDMTGDGIPDTGLPSHSSHDCCIVCAAPQPPLPRLADTEPLRFEPLRNLAAAPEPVLHYAAPPSDEVFRPLSQRGPPA